MKEIKNLKNLTTQELTEISEYIKKGVSWQEESYLWEDLQYYRYKSLDNVWDQFEREVVKNVA